MDPTPETRQDFHYKTFSKLLSTVLNTNSSCSSYQEVLEELEVMIYCSNSPQQALGLKKITKSSLKRHYKTLALLFHPDKNPKSSETFVIINNAYQTLQNYLENFETSSKPHKNPNNHNKIPKYPDYDYNPTYCEEEYCFGLNPFLVFSLFPIAMLFFISLFASLGIFNKKYSLEKTILFSKQVLSSKYKIEYWINPENAEDLIQIDAEVEAEWVQSLVNDCQMNGNRKEHLISMALNAQEEVMRDYYYLAGQIDLSSCYLLENLNFTYDWF
jgi:Domain of unknown function (DUF1977)/DnaJ domain